MAEFTIVGGGLAGCVLGWSLSKRGCDFKIIDRFEKITSTQVAAGIINPITGPSLTKGPRLEELWDKAKDFYRSLEKVSGIEMFRETKIVRLMDSDKQAERWKRRMLDPEYRALVSEQPLGLTDNFNSDHGGFVTNFGAHLNTIAFLEVIKKLLSKHWIEGVIEEPSNHGVTIYCEGVRAIRNPLFDWVKFKPAKGEILTVKIPDIAEDRIVVRGNIWLLPLGESIFRVGATYDWNANDCETTFLAREALESRLQKLLNASFEVIDHQAAVRPVIDTRKALIGLHPGNDRIGFFNGLGSKGVLSAPYLAEQLVDHILDSSPIDPEFDVRGNI